MPGVRCEKSQIDLVLTRALSISRIPLVLSHDHPGQSQLCKSTFISNAEVISNSAFTQINAMVFQMFGYNNGPLVSEDYSALSR